MARWQTLARAGAALVGVAGIVAVYATMKERVVPVETPPPQRLDPKAMIESSGNVLQQVSGARQDYVVEAARQLYYEGGATTLVGVKISVRNRGGRDYVVTGAEAHTAEGQKQLELKGGVHLEANDGFRLETDVATFNQESGVMSAPGMVRFERGRLTGTGVGMTYDKSGDILTLHDQSHVTLAGDDEAEPLEFTAGRTVFDRMRHTLALDGPVHVVDGPQVIDARACLAQLTDDEARVRRIELRGESRVTGGRSSVESMAARDIDLDYADDGDTLQHALLDGAGVIALTGQAGVQGRTIRGDRLDLALAPDGALTSAIGRGGVSLDLPAAPGGAARSIRARSLDAAGEAGKGLTATRFTDDVEYREVSGRGAGSGRVARSRALTAALDGDEIGEAVFSGAARFEQDDLRGTAAEARYLPSAGSLRLSGTEAGALPRVQDANVIIDGREIDVSLADRGMEARGGVKTTLLPAATGGPRTTTDTAKRPGLFAQGTVVNVSADAIAYEGSARRASYRGDATLWQGETAIRANVIDVDEVKGDLTATGNARSTIAMDGGSSIAQANTIRYVDATRAMHYSGLTDAKGATAQQARLSGPQGDLQADRIDVVLRQGATQMERLDAAGRVSLRVTGRTATGATLSYAESDGRYVMTGAGTTGISIVDGCRETVGRTLVLFTSSERVIVDGNEEARTRTKSGSGAACGPAPAR